MVIPDSGSCSPAEAGFSNTANPSSTKYAAKIFSRCSGSRMKSFNNFAPFALTIRAFGSVPSTLVINARVLIGSSVKRNSAKRLKSSRFSSVGLETMIC